jgi:cephalosporin hydroxylase
MHQMLSSQRPPRDARLRQPAEVERIGREFAVLYNELLDQTFSTTRWLGVPIVKAPTDIFVIQEIVTETRPELIVESGAFAGGSALLCASLLELLGVDGKVVAIDIDLRAVPEAVREHPRVELVESSSIDPALVSRLKAEAEGKRVMVDLDSDHSAAHVLEELRALAPLVTPGCYLIVEDGWVGGHPVRPEDAPGPSEALTEWLADGPHPFEVDRWRERLLLTTNPRGYLRRVDGEFEDPSARRRRPFLLPALERHRFDPQRDSSGATTLRAELDAERRLRREADRRLAGTRRRLDEATGSRGYRWYAAAIRMSPFRGLVRRRAQARRARAREAERNSRR